MRRNLTPYVCASAVAGLALLATCLTVSTALAGETKAAERAKGQGSTPLLTVRLYNEAGVPPDTLAAAENETVRIFRDAGIELFWAPCPVSRPEFDNTPAKFAACVQASDAPIVTIATQSEAHSILHNSAVAGAAVAYDVAISYGRLQRVSSDFAVSQATLLGHVMTHELGHILLGHNSHALAGIMIPDFRREELLRAQAATLLFLPRQAAQMRARLRRAAWRDEVSRPRSEQGQHQVGPNCLRGQGHKEPKIDQTSKTGVSVIAAASGSPN